MELISCSLFNNGGSREDELTFAFIYLFFGFTFLEFNRFRNIKH